MNKSYDIKKKYELVREVCYARDIVMFSGQSLSKKWEIFFDAQCLKKWIRFWRRRIAQILGCRRITSYLFNLLEKSQVNIFHCGCVIGEICNHRQSSNMKFPGYQSMHMLLCPITQILICDVHSVISDNNKWM